MATLFGQFVNRNRTRPPPPSGQPPPYMFTRYFRTNLRPVIIGVGFAAMVYSLIWGGSALSTIHPDQHQNLSQLVPFDIALGVAYMTVALIEIFGIFGAFRQSLPIIRIYAFLSLVAAVLVFGAEILRLVVHFKFKNDMITQCITAAESPDGVGDETGLFGNHHASDLDPLSATDFCNDAWSHNTFSDIAWLLISLICSLVFASLAYSYYRQLLDPTSGVARARPRGNNVPLDTFRNYNEYAAGSSLPYNAGGSRPAAPRAGSIAPSEFVPPYEPTKLPGYGSAFDEPDKKVPTDEEKDLGGVSH